MAIITDYDYSLSSPWQLICRLNSGIGNIEKSPTQKDDATYPSNMAMECQKLVSKDYIIEDVQPANKLNDKSAQVLR